MISATIIQSHPIVPILVRLAMKRLRLNIELIVENRLLLADLLTALNATQKRLKDNFFILPTVDFDLPGHLGRAHEVECIPFSRSYHVPWSMPFSVSPPRA